MAVPTIRKFAARRARLGLPRINEDPQPPGHQGPRQNFDSNRRFKGHRSRFESQNFKGGRDNRDRRDRMQGARNAPRNALDRVRNGGNKPGPGPSTPPAPTPAGQVAQHQALTSEKIQQQIDALGNNPASALAFSSFTPGPGQVDPRDEEYWRNVTNLLHSTQGQYAEGVLAGTRSALDYERGISDMEVSRQRSQRALAEESMRSGLANSGYHDVSSAEQGYDFLRDFEDYSTDYQRSEQDRKAGMSQLIQEFLRGESELATGALSRYDEAQRDRMAEEDPLYDPATMRRITRLLNRQARGRRGGKNNKKGRR